MAQIQVKVQDAAQNTKEQLGVEKVIFVSGERGAQYMFQRYVNGQTRFIIGIAARGFGKNCRPSSAVIAAAQAA